MSKKEIIEELSTETNGVTYIGKRKIIGTTSLDQIVSYNNKCVKDLHGYEPNQKDTIMLTIAKQILAELVTDRSISTENSSKYGL